MPQTTEPYRISLREHGRYALAVLVLSTAMSGSALAFDKPPTSPDQATPAVTPSSLSATIQIGMRALDDALERRVPRRLATFDDRMTECWHRRILGREIDVDCVYSGYVERVGSIPLRAEDSRLVASTPLSGFLTAQGTGRFTSRLHGTATGQMTVFASGRPRLRPDWSVALDMSEGFRWTEPPILTILVFKINLARYVEPRIRSQLARVQDDFERKARELDIRGKAAFAWQQAFQPVKIVDTPAVWLQATPQSIAFSGLRIRNSQLEGSLDIAGTVETVIGNPPPSSQPTPLPALHGDVSEPGHFSVIVPINIGYDQVRQKLQEVLAARAQSGGLNLRELTVYPSAGKLVAGLHLSVQGENPGDDQWIYITATPQASTDSGALQLADVAFAADTSRADSTPLAALLGDTTLKQTLLQQVRFEFQNQLQTTIASANARLTRPLGNGFRSEGHLTSVEPAKILLLSDGIRLDIRASGDLRILYGL
jgi:Domain of unknown function (DUF4403)